MLLTFFCLNHNVNYFIPISSLSGKSNVAPAIVPKGLVPHIDSIINARNYLPQLEYLKNVAVPKDETYVFALPNQNNHVDGLVALDKVASAAGLGKIFKSTALRHLLATEMWWIDLDPKHLNL